MQNARKSVEQCGDYAGRIAEKLKELKMTLQEQVENIKQAIKNVLGRFVGKFFTFL